MKLLKKLSVKMQAKKILSILNLKLKLIPEILNLKIILKFCLLSPKENWDFHLH